MIVLAMPFSSLMNIVRQHVGHASPIVEIVQRRFNTEAEVVKFKSPTLIVHGDCDELIPISHSRALFDKLTVEKKKLHVMQNCTHTVYDRTNDIAIPIKNTLAEWNIDIEATSFTGDIFEKIHTAPHTDEFDTL